MRFKVFLQFIIIIGLTNCLLFAKSSFVNQIPNGSNFSCKNCHTGSSGGSLNSFGSKINQSFISGGKVVWNNSLAKLDSDGDGFTNGTELQDENGTWIIGQSNPGDNKLVTNPGSSTSKPTGVEDNNLEKSINNIINLSCKNINSKLAFDYTLNYDSYLSFKIYNLDCENIIESKNEFLKSGSYHYIFNGNHSIPSGIYLIVFDVNGFIITKKIQIIN